LPNIVVIPWARKRSNVASRTVGTNRTLLGRVPGPNADAGFKTRAS
jgi:hypothetical protein